MLTELIFQRRGKLQVFISFAKCQQSVSKASYKRLCKRQQSAHASIGKVLVQASDKHHLFIDRCSRRHGILAQYFAQYFGVVFGTVLGAVRRGPAQFGTVFSCRSLRFLRVLHNNFRGNLYHCVLLFSATMLLRSLFRSERFLRYLYQE